MPTLNLGQVRPVYRGAWTSIDTYSAYDFVIYNGSAYLALKDVPANYEPPSQTEYWVLFGAKGDTGAPGQDGVDGEPGERGPSPGYRWDGTFLSIQNPDGTWPDQGINLQGPPVPLSNSVTSTSETDAASSLAAKTAYDRGSSGITAAETAQSAAETAQSAAETARSAAETAQSAAETAQSAVNTLRTDVPLIAANAAGPSDKSIDISFTGSTTVIAPEDGYCSIEGVTNSDNGFVYLENKSNKIKDVSSRWIPGSGVYAYLYVSKGNSVFWEAENCTSVIARFVYTNGNAPA
jgi:hypothetical protein